MCVEVCVCVCVCVWSRRYDHSNIYHDPRKRVSTARGVGGWGSGYKCILLSQRVLVSVNEKVNHKAMRQMT